MIPIYISELCRKHKVLVFRYFASSIGKAVCSMLAVVMIQQFLAVTHHSAGSLVRFLRPLFGDSAVPLEMALLLVSVHILASLLTYDNKITAQRLSESLQFSLMERIIRNLLRLSVQFFKQRGAPELIQTASGDTTILRNMAFAYASIVQSSMMAIAFASIAFWLSPLLAFLSLILLPFAGAFMVSHSRKHILVASRKLRARGPFMTSAILQIVSGIRIIKAYAGEETEARLSIENGRITHKIMMQMVRLQSRMQVFLESLGGLSLVVVITVGGYQVAHGKMSWDGLVAFVFTVRSLFGPIYEINTATKDIHGSQASLERIRELIEAEPTVVNAPNSQPLNSAPRVIRFEEVGFSYDGPEILKDLSFEVHSGETIGIVGPSGGGKSTLLNLIARYYDPSSGRITFDGVDLKSYRLSDVYSQLSIVSQEPFLFHTTVRENIRCARPEASDREVEDAAKDSSIHEDIMALPLGYDTVLGPGGRELSRGQSQRVNVARALLKNSPLLILDEATASLDSVSEAVVQRAIDRLMQGRTCFIVAHRLSTLRAADRLIVLDRGRCAGFGRHAELLEECSLYRQLWQLQMLGEPALDSPVAQPTIQNTVAVL